MKDIYICSTKRTPLGGFQGALASFSACQLGAHAIQASLNASKLTGADFDEVYMGNVVSAGLGQAPARQAALLAGVSEATPCTTISKVCGSGMQAVMQAANSIRAGQGTIMMAGGMESMSNAPYLLEKARSGHRLGHTQTRDALFVDGLEDAASGRLMGEFGQETADRFNITREQMDDYALESLRRARVATDEGYFNDEISPITVKTRRDTYALEKDEQLTTARPEKVRSLKPAFSKDGSITAANSSSISDGAASMIVADKSALEKYSLTASARLVAQASYARKPAEFTIAPIGAVERVLTLAGWSTNDVDLFEINEAFAVVALQAMSELALPHEKVNIHGGACALGHPLGASGARILVTLIHALQRTGGRRGVASLCIGGGEATAVAIELC